MAIVGHFSSLAQVQKIVDEVLLAGVIETIIEEGGILSRMPVTRLSGESLIYNREAELPSGQWVSIGDVLTSEASVTYSQVTVTLKRLIAQGDVDHFIAKTYDNPNDPRAQAIGEARKGFQRTLEDALIYGNATSNPEEINGLHALTDATMQINQGTTSTGAALSLNNLDTLIDSIRPGPPDILFGSRAWYRRMSQLGRMSGTTFPIMFIQEDPNNVASWITTYRGIPLIRSDYALQTETISGSAYSAATGGATSSVFAISFGPIGEGKLTMLLGNEIMELVEFENLENKDAMRYRLIAYPAMALGAVKSLGRIDGITDAAVVI